MNKDKPTQPQQPPAGPLDTFFEALESGTSDATHLRLLKAARKPDPAAALEREFEKVIKELLSAD